MINRKYFYQSYHIIFGALCFSLPFENVVSALPNILLIFLGVVSLFLLKKDSFINLITKERSYIALFIFVFSVFLFSLINGQLTNDIFILKKLIVPCLFIVFSIPLKGVNYFKGVFILSVFLAVFISTYNIIGYIETIGVFKFSKGSHINELLVAERLYIGLCCVISMTFSLDLYRRYKTKKKLKILFLLNTLLLLMFVFLIVARIAIISSIILLIYFLNAEFRLKQKIVFSIAIIMFSLVFFSLNKNLTKRFLHFDDKFSTSYIDKIKKHEPRFEIWKCCLNIIETDYNFILGNGFHNTKEQLVNCYGSNIKKEQRKEWFVSRAFNTHNEFLDILISSGLISFILLLSVFYFLFLRGNYSFITISLLSVLLLIMLVENIFHRQVGGFLFSLIFIIIIKDKIESKTHNNKIK